ncbi:MAG: hypothetical protein IPM99_19260 [Rubrivivax sp.]|nr:hypothetical protein [Rubrivivax sp.]
MVFGHRRHRACLELGLPVQAMVVDMYDQQLFEAMERENRARKNLSAWEQGTMYRRALDEGLYPSQRRLAESLGVDISLVSRVCRSRACLTPLWAPSPARWRFSSDGPSRWLKHCRKTPTECWPGRRA